MSQNGNHWSVNFSVLAGAGGGFVSSIATCPLDVIKTKLQAQATAHTHINYLGVWDTIKAIARTDGFRGFYRGLGPTILGYLPTWAIYFAVYDGIKRSFGEAPLGGNPPPSQLQSRTEVQSISDGTAKVKTRTPEGKVGVKLIPAAQVKGYQPVVREQPWGLHILSAMTAGACSTIATNPLWVIKTRFMTQPPNESRYKHTLDAFLTIYRAEGVPAFYRGLGSSLLGISHVAVQFPLYEQLKQWAQSRSDAPLPSTSIVACSAASKMVASIATYPHEVVRTRLQTQKRLIGQKAATSLSSLSHTPAKYLGVWQTTKVICQEESWRGLYKGLSINLFRTVPNSVVTMLTYELVMRYLSGRHPDQ